MWQNMRAALSLTGKDGPFAADEGAPRPCGGGLVEWPAPTESPPAVDGMVSDPEGLTPSLPR
jgi:hypothetical protein